MDAHTINDIIKCENRSAALVRCWFMIIWRYYMLPNSLGKLSWHLKSLWSSGVRSVKADSPSAREPLLSSIFKEELYGPLSYELKQCFEQNQCYVLKLSTSQIVLLTFNFCFDMPKCPRWGVAPKHAVPIRCLETYCSGLKMATFCFSCYKNGDLCPK